VHSVPSTPALQFVEPGVGWPHVPSVWPLAIVHNPPQHSASCAHASPFWVQNDEGPQVPPELHSPEQHASPPCMHGLPSVRQVVLSGTHLPVLHLPLQHWPFCVHVLLSAVHLSWHTPPTQLTEQQSVFTEHEALCGEHDGPVAVNLLVVGSHIPVQQSLALPQV